ncbi:MAG: hypothetical protein O7H41_05670 [Planctomycetota bacterium]|nr:hypothetical protein [Planctomycetota bacterium]
MIYALLMLPILLPQDTDQTHEKLLKHTYAELEKTQQEDGRWIAPKETPESLGDRGMTALAMFVLTAAGNTHRHGGLQDRMKKGLGFLLEAPDEDGAPRSDADRAFEAMIMAELYAVTRDFTIKRPALLAMQNLLKRQKEDGGFGKGILETCLASMAMESCRNAEFPVELGKSKERVLEYLTGMIGPGGLRFTEKIEPMHPLGAAAAVYLGRRYAFPYENDNSLREDALQKFLKDQMTHVTYPAEDPRGAYFIGYGLMFIQSKGAFDAFASAQDEWIAKGKRSPDLAGRLYEALAMQVRDRHKLNR